MDSSRKSDKIRDIVRLQQILKKWKKVATNNKSTSTSTSGSTSSGKSIRFLKKTLSFSETSSSGLGNNTNGAVPKGYIAVCVGKELKRFVIPTEYLSHRLFGILLREAEEEFGFQQEGVLKFPCEVDLFEKILKMMEHKRSTSSLSSSVSSPSLMMLSGGPDDEFGLVVGDHHELSISCANNYSPDSSELTPSHHHHHQMCR
ncbi:hypothetical protein CDL12_03404 [Handroanthus impetiginosus]|uniref:Small auxin-up RNA n=1 Tax=Handroanthus impetiginosus TaxID=429701 RepID=A0A2G9I2B3_9LAMI|nr:hypothetical protein CDL12_03404 [Handroanthus impetiginosus]